MRVNMIVDGAAITKSDTTPLTVTGVRLGDATAQTITVRFAGNGNTLLFSNVQPGEIIYGDFDRVMSTGTSATLIEGLEVR